MAIQFFKSLWGMSEPPPLAAERIARAGYEGLEAPLFQLPLPAERSGLLAVGQAFCETPDSLRDAIGQGAKLEIALLNVQAGKDYWPLDAAARFFEDVLAECQQAPFPVCFETHRGRLLNTPWTTRFYLERFPELVLTADLSHWTCVCESLLHDQEADVDLALSRAGYLHARVGHEQGPQVPDPRSPRWQAQVERFEALWDRWIALGGERWINPEYGPPNYLWSEANSGEPLADLWEVCLDQRDRLRRRWTED